jgi:hypothetical protein
VPSVLRTENGGLNCQFFIKKVEVANGMTGVGDKKAGDGVLIY